MRERISNRRTVCQETTGEKISSESKSIPSFCLSPLTQNLPLSFRTLPSGYRLHLNAHVDGSTFIVLSLGTTSQTSIFSRVLISFSAAIQYWSANGPFIASSQVVLSSELAFAARISGWSHSQVDS